MRRALCLLLAGLALPACAQASTSMNVTFEAPRDLQDAATRDSAFEQMSGLGARSMRVILYWNQVAPDRDSATRPTVDLTDPSAYDWSTYEPILQAPTNHVGNTLVI